MDVGDGGSLVEKLEGNGSECCQLEKLALADCGSDVCSGRWRRPQACAGWTGIHFFFQEAQVRWFLLLVGVRLSVV